MKPSFALDFRDGQIALLHRTSRGWQPVGATAFDAPDLAEALNYLRSTALGLSPRGVTTKLVIPNDQILYTQVHAPGPEVAKRKRQIRAALEGLTPYKVEDLAFDWWGNGPEVQVAVVPRETLAEAEAFAAEHRFNPVSFVAGPDDGRFAGEPFFGPSALTATLLAPGEKVERDQDPIAVLARDYPKAEPIADPEFGPEPLPVAAMDEADAAAPVEPEQVTAELAPVAELPMIESPAVESPVAQSPVAEPPAIELSVVEAVVADPAPADLADHDPLPDFRAARAPAAGISTFDLKAMAVDLVDEAPMAEDVRDEAPELQTAALAPQATPPTPVADPTRPGPEAAGTAPSIIAGFASRRASGTDPEAVADGLPADFAAAAKAKKPPAIGPAPSLRPTVPRPAMAKPASPLPSAQRDTVPFPVKKAAAKFIPGRSGKLGVTAPGIAGPRSDRNVVPLPKSTAPGDETAAPKIAHKGLTGLDGRPLPVRGKPRFLGLILTAILLIALAMVAAWSSFYLTSNEADPAAVPASTAVAEGAATGPADTAEVLPTIEDEALADGQATEEDTAAAVAEPDSAAVAEPAAVAVTEPAPVTAVISDAAVAAAPGNDPQDEIFLAAADTPPKTFDPLALPQLAANSDPPPDAALPPPPFGTVYTFDAAGRIQPTPEGILTPEGVLLIAGKPVRVPPVRPTALAAVAPVVPVANAPVADPVAAVPDPALAGKKPRLRPAELVVSPETATQQGEVAAPASTPELAPGQDSRFASVRPQKRPGALTQTAAVEPEVANEAAAASLAANGVQASTSALAVVVSKKPAARPSGMDQAVEAAVAAAVRAPEPEAQPEQQAAAAPEAEPEPEVEAAAPSLPTNASVAKQATVKNALNLSRVSLLGIFGTSSGRYAMIRQAGGGVKKIKVGDTLDGGRVAAISATEVQYQKGGRMVTLSLPTG